MINLHVFGDFDVRPIFGGPGDLNIGDFLSFFAFFFIQISKPFFGRPKMRFLAKIFQKWSRWAVRAAPVSKA